MYKILIKYIQSSSLQNMWQVYGTTTTTSATANSSAKVVSFEEFSTDDITVLEKEVAELDKIYGHENIRVIKDLSYTVSVDVLDDENANETDKTE